AVLHEPRDHIDRIIDADSDGDRVRHEIAEVELDPKGGRRTDEPEDAHRECADDIERRLAPPQYDDDDRHDAGERHEAGQGRSPAVNERGNSSIRSGRRSVGPKSLSSCFLRPSSMSERILGVSSARICRTISSFSSSSLGKTSDALRTDATIA